MTRYTLPLSAIAFVFVANCAGRTNAGADGGDASLTDVVRADGDSSTMGIDANPADADGAVGSDSAIDGSTGDVANDATGSDVANDTASSSDSGSVCSPGVECSNFAAALAAAPRNATSIDNCVIQLHQSDCCGATRAYGINHAARTTLCPAETTCVAMYPTPPGCSDMTITTDTGETTTNPSDVKLRIVDPAPCGFDPTITCYTCQTFVCTTLSCASAPGIAGGCGP